MKGRQSLADGQQESPVVLLRHINLRHDQFPALPHLKVGVPDLQPLGAHYMILNSVTGA